jgi:transcription initiation factor TFIID TATA-box-binding protein
VSNCVATAWFDTQIDIKKLVWTCYGELDPTTFAAAKFRLGKAKTRALVFSSGKIVCTGSTSIEELYLSVQQLQILVNKIHPQAQCFNICVQNIVTTAYVGGNIDLLQLYDILMKRGVCDAVYTPELFPGLRLSAKSLSDSLPNVKVLIFSVGNVVITGGKNLKELDKTWDFVKQILDNFRTESRIEHRTIISNLKQSRLSQSSHDL